MENNMIAVVNPITRVATILHYVNDTLNEIKINFTDLDEWSGFDTDKAYDVHFYYDEHFMFYINEINTDEGEGAIRGDYEVDFTLIVEYNDYDFNLAVMNNILKLKGNENI